jgi:hypothetical protein
MTKNNIFATLSAAAMLALPLSAAMAQPAPQPPTEPVAPLEYAAKFVCSGTGGTVDGPLRPPQFSPGRYTTSINIHNPNRRADFTWKVTIALVEIPGPMTAFKPMMTLRYDQAVDIDCGAIRGWMRANGVVISALITGFVVVQSRQELDVVAVYTASPVGTGQVSSIHTERVPLRKLP